MADTNNGNHITLAQAANLSPGRPSSNAIWRWCRTGLKARSGERIRLDHIRAGGRLFTCEADLAAFFKRLADADRIYFEPTPTEPLNGQTNHQRAQAVEHAHGVLAKAGIA